MPKIKYLTQEEVFRFFAKIKDRRDKAMFKLMYDFGLRASEVGKLALKDGDTTVTGLTAKWKELEK